jgi:hypothetical protein
MIVLVLVVIWLCALAPFVLRRLSEHQLTASISQFRHLTGMFGGRQPSNSWSDEGWVPARPLERSADEARRASRQRARVRRLRRRRALTGLIGCGAFTLVFGAIPALRALWDLTVVDLLLTVGYLYLLARCTKLESFEAERRAMRNVVPLSTRQSGHSERRSSLRQPAFAAVGGSGTALPVPIQLRPAFRIVEAPR